MVDDMVRNLRTNSPESCGRIDVVAYGGPFFHVTCDVRESALGIYILGGIRCVELDTPRAFVQELYPHPVAHEVFGGYEIRLDPYDPAPFVTAETEAEAWAAAEQLLHNLPDD